MGRKRGQIQEEPINDRGSVLRNAIPASFIVLMLSLVVFSTIALGDGSDASGDYEGDEYTVVYHPFIGDSLGKEIRSDCNSEGPFNEYTCTYYGSIVSTEYNPQFWNVAERWYPIKSYSVGKTLVFAGWSYLQKDSQNYSEPKLPGDIMSPGEIDAATTVDGVTHIYANWEELDSFFEIERYWYNYNLNRHGTVSGSVYTNILVNEYNLSANNLSTLLDDINGPVTIRGIDGTIQLGTNSLTLNYDTIIDSTNLTGSFSTSSTHGDGGIGLFANGHTFVIGEGVSTGNGTSNNNYPQIFGGSNGGTVSGTKTIIHTGTFGNLIAGSRGGTVNGNTCMILRDVHVLDTLIGASSSTGWVDGSTYIYATSLDMHGDYYEERQLSPSYTGAGQNSKVSMTESTILTGGSNNGVVTGSTHVFISGDSVLWDVQGAGRRGQSQVMDTSNVEVSGKAWVKHVVCGSITDGLDGSNSGVKGSNECVKNTSIIVCDSSKVGSVFGAGYDTFYKARYSSMYNGGKIQISIEDNCTVGYVYGGGYRGTIGSTSGDGGGKNNLDLIDIRISGGTILEDVFGGGRGGVDKICHNTDGSHNWGSSHNDSTGYSKVFVNEIIITLSGGIVEGDVYGGGESVPYLSGGYSHESGVAYVECGTLTINVLNGCSIKGDVYGGGKGVSVRSTSTGPAITVMGDDGNLHDIPWLKSNPSYATYNESIYSRYASMDASYIHINLAGAGTIGGVFGGGAFGTVDTQAIYIDIKNTRILEGIYGGGMGYATYNELGVVTSRSIDMEISNGSIVGTGLNSHSIIGGGAFAFTDVGSVSIDLKDSSTQIRGDVHLGGLGYEISNGDSPIIMDGDERTLTLDGALVNGSIYGGSRLGEDRPLDGTTSNDTARILVLSGTVTQSIYGGGFQGESQMDSDILIGSPAFEYLGTTPRTETGHDHVPLTMLLHNIYGGGNLSGGEAYASSLLLGSSTITIGGTFEDGKTYRMGNEILDGNKTHVMCIHGNIFGDGNYSTVGGTSTITIEGYDQFGDHSIWSIQRANTLIIDRSHLEIRGAADGGSTELSQEVSINRVGSFVLAGNSHLELHSETSRIGSYLSSTDGTSLMKRSDVTLNGDELIGNRISMYDGRMFSVLGESNTGYIDKPINGGLTGNGQYDDGEEHTGLVRGYTVLSRGGDNTYFGAYAVASMGTDNSESGFLVVSGNSLINANILDGDGRVNHTRMWYIVGHVEIGRTWTFSDSKNWMVDDSISLPRMGGSGTNFAYNGITNDPLALGTLLVVDGLEFNKFVNPAEHTGFNVRDHIGDRMFFGIGMSGGLVGEGSKIVESHYLTEDFSWIREHIGSYEVLGGSTIQLDLHGDLLSKEYYGTDDHLGSSGIVGDITLSFLELKSYDTGSGSMYLPVNMVDVEITLYVEPCSVSDDEVQLATAVNVMLSNGSHHGTGYIILPSMGRINEYRLNYNEDGFTDGDDHNVSLSADDQYLNQLGWITTDYDSTSLNVLTHGNTSLDEEVVFGTGGIRPSVIKIDYEGIAVNDQTLDLHIEAIDESKKITTYHVRITFQEAGNVSITLVYSPIYDGGKKYLSRDLVSDNYHELSWDEKSGSAISIPYGSSIGSYSCEIGGQNLTILEMMNQSISKIPVDSRVNTDSGLSKFDYVKYFHGWYLDSNHTRQFNTSEALREDVTLYAGFGVTIRFHGNGVNVVPQVVTIEPGTSLNDNGLYNIEQTIVGNKGIKPYSGTGNEVVGHYLKAFLDADHDDADTDDYHLSWATSLNSEYSELDFGQKLYSDFDGDSFIDLYLPWIPYSYNMGISFNNSPSGSSVSRVVESGNEVNVNNGVWTVRYGEQVSIQFNHNVSSVTAKTGDDDITGSFSFSGFDTKELTFTVPLIADRNDANFTITVVLVTGMTLKIEYSVNDLSNRLGDSESIEVIVKTTDGNDNTENKMELCNQSPSSMMTVGSDETVSVTVSSDGYHVALWFDGKLKDLNGSLGGRISSGSTVELGKLSDDSTVTISVYRPVGFKNTVLVGEGKPITKIKVTDRPLSGDGNTSEWKGGQSILFKGYSIGVTTADTYSVFKTEGVEGSGPYTVLGTVDVDLLCKTDSTWTLKVTFMKSNGYPLDIGSLIRSTEGTNLAVDCDGERMVFDLSKEVGDYDDPTGSLNKTLPGFEPSLTVVCSLSGFHHNPSASVDETVDVHVTLVLTEYTITFRGSSDERQDVHWNVLSGNEIPQTTVETAMDQKGDEIWLSSNLHEQALIVSRIGMSMFDEDRCLNLYHLAVFSVKGLNPDGSPVYDHIIVLTSKQLVSGYDVELDLGDQYDSWSMDGITASYSAEGKRIQIGSAVAGTGAALLIINEQTLLMYVLPDFEVVS